MGKALAKRAPSIGFVISAAAVLVFNAVAAHGRSRGVASAAGFPPGQEGYTVQQGAGGTVEGKVLYAGKPVKPQRVSVTQDMAACGATMDTYPVRVEEGGVADAVVWIDDVSHGKAFSFPKPVLDQRKCVFVPHVLLMAPGDLQVTNSDNATHNVHIFAHFNRESNSMMAPGASPADLTLMRPETITVRCDVHTWMQAFIVIAKNPYYAVTGAGGAFRLTDVPSGTYHLKLWQEKLGSRDQTVTVEAGKTATVNFTLGS